MMSSYERDVEDEMITALVGGVPYALYLSDIQAHKDCYFENAIKDVWNHGQQTIVIDRDGKLFQHIYVYLYNCRHEMSFAATGPLELLASVRREADYYNFPKLVALYDEACQKALIRWCERLPLSVWCDGFAVASRCDGALSVLEELVKAEVYPECLSGILEPIPSEPSVSENTKLITKLRKHRAVSNPAVATNVFKLRRVESYEDYLYELGEVLPVLPGVPCRLTDWYMQCIMENGFKSTSAKGADSSPRIGAVVYILNSPYTGGVITVTRNGMSKSISKPGEYIVYTDEYSLDIGIVTSGALLFAEFIIERHSEENGPFRAFLKPRLALYPALPSQKPFLEAVHSELCEVAGANARASVVLCLSTLYPISEFDPNNMHFETDPDVLVDRDAVLYAYLKDAFDVTLVIACVQRYAKSYRGCILAAPATVGTNVGSRTKIIAPFHNFREFCTVDNEGDEPYTTLYTAMFIKNK